MIEKPPSKKPKESAKMREDRLKQALKANLARRKAQMRARTGDEAVKDEDKG